MRDGLDAILQMLKGIEEKSDRALAEIDGGGGVQGISTRLYHVEQEINRLSKDCQERVRAVRKEHQLAIRVACDAHDRELKALDDTYKERMDNLRKAHDQEIKRSRRGLESIEDRVDKLERRDIAIKAAVGTGIVGGGAGAWSVLQNFFGG